ncbi:FAM86A [Xylariaceae sp. FL0804]|nr:FAM86A [Xylariaceae sp. FL0804]
MDVSNAGTFTERRPLAAAAGDSYVAWKLPTSPRVPRAQAMADADADADDIVLRFCREVLQLEEAERGGLHYPPASLLREERVQGGLARRVFFADGDGAAVDHPPPPPPRYRLRVLKELVARIEESIDDWDQHGVSDELMSSLAGLLSAPLPGHDNVVGHKSYVTYTLSLLGPAPAPQITLLEQRNLISASGTTGLRTWEAALHLGQFLCTSSELIRGKRVLELGAGTGYLSILCARYLGAAQVIASDGSDDVVANLPENFYLNGLQGESKISPMDVKWGHALVGTEEQHWNGAKPIDVVIGADVTYDQRAIPPLIATLQELTNMFPRIEVLIAATERNRSTFESFIDVCHQTSLRVSEVNYPITPREEQQGPFYSDKVPIRICRILSTGDP